MGFFDIRLRKKCGSIMVYSTAKASDMEAIRAANALTSDCSTVEVWKGMRCIYSSHGAGLAPPLTVVRAALR